MTQSAANLVDHVLPIVPLRQFVVTFPFNLCARLAYDGKLLGAGTRIAIDSILGYYKRRMRDIDGVLGQSGAGECVPRELAGGDAFVRGARPGRRGLRLVGRAEEAVKVRTPNQASTAKANRPDVIAPSNRKE